MTDEIYQVGPDVLSGSYFTDPYPILARWRAVSPVLRTELGFWAVLGYDECREVLRSTEIGHRYGEAARLAERFGISDPGTPMSELDPPEHTAPRATTVGVLREAMSQAPRLVADTAEGLLAALDGRSVDLMSQFAEALPFRVICGLFGIPQDDHAQLALWSRQSTGGMDPWSSEAAVKDSLRARASLREYLGRHIRRPAFKACPLGGFAEFAGTAVGAGQADDVASDAEFLLIAAHETTSGLIGNAIIALADNPRVQARLRGDLDRIDARTVSEFARLDSPVHAVLRHVKQPVDLAGREFEPGDQVVVLFGAANRDPRRWPNPDMLDLDRPQRANLAFSHGIHMCPGSQLANLEIIAALRGLLTRFPKLELAGEIEREPSFFLRRPRALPVKLG